MDEMHLCVCCLRCPPDKDLTTPYAHHDNTEIYSDMLQDCFNIQMVLDGWGSSGICLTCAGRLRDAGDFKLQVQRCQAELRVRTLARSHVKEEEPDMGLPAEQEEETGYEHVLQELPGPGLADGAGASDDEESTVKLEMITIDEGELYAEPVVEAEESGDEERPQQELPGPGLADGAGASDDEESTVKQEMITVDEEELFGAESGVSLRARRQLAAACAVRLERLRAPPAPARRASARHTYACDMCTQRFYSKSVLIKHIGSHYRCAVCDKSFMMSDCLTQHERNCTENKQKERKLANKNTLSKSHGEVVLYYCDECGKGFKRKIFLSKHIQRSHSVRQVLNNSHSRLLERQVRLTQKKPFHCSQCVFKSSKKSRLQRHQMVHTGEKPFKCEFCDFICCRKSNLQRHQRTHTGAKPFKCGICDYNVSDKSSFRKHKMIHTGEKPFKCGICDHKCSLKQQLETHQRTHTGEKPFKCGYCDYKCSDKSSIRKHKMIHTGEKPFKCGICDYKCSQKQQLQTHQRTHTGEKPFKCAICDYKCSLKQQLQTHQRTHTGEKPFKCGYCDYKCSDKSSIRKHKMIHTGEKPFKCGICDYKCSLKQQLQTHQRTHTGEKPFKCGYCDYKCSDKSSIRKHKMIHTGEKPFKCGICDYKCSLKQQLQTHQRTHTGEKPFKCGICDYKCTQKSTLQRHRRIHTGEKPFKCGYCDYKSSSKTNLRRHEMVHRRAAV